MWKFIKYCLFCVMLALSVAYSSNAPDASFKDLIVGIITMYVLAGLFFGIIWLVILVMRIINKSK